MQLQPSVGTHMWFSCIKYYKSFLNNLIFMPNMFKNCSKGFSANFNENELEVYINKKLFKSVFSKKSGTKSRSHVLLYGRTNLITKK